MSPIAMSISQLLSSCYYLFTVSNSGLLSVQRPRPDEEDWQPGQGYIFQVLYWVSIPYPLELMPIIIIIKYERHDNIIV